jgi:tetratricopeptide (TPR) repeat protein
LLSAFIKVLWLLAICSFSWIQVLGFLLLYVPLSPLLLVFRKGRQQYKENRAKNLARARQEGAETPHLNKGLALLFLLLMWFALYGGTAQRYPLIIAMAITGLLFIERVSRALLYATAAEFPRKKRSEAFTHSVQNFMRKTVENFKEGKITELKHLNGAIRTASWILRLARFASTWMYGKAAKRRAALFVLIRFMGNLAILGGLSILFWAFVIKYFAAPPATGMEAALFASASRVIPGVPDSNSLHVSPGIQALASVTAWLIFVLYAGPVASLFPAFQERVIAQTAQSYDRLRSARKTLYRFIEPLRALRELAGEHPELIPFAKTVVLLRKQANLKEFLAGQPDYVRSLASHPEEAELLRTLGVKLPDLNALVPELTQDRTDEPASGAQSDANPRASNDAPIPISIDHHTALKDSQDPRFLELLAKLDEQVTAARLSRPSLDDDHAPNLGVGDPSAVPNTRADERFASGLEHERRLEWPESLSAFREAWKIEKIPKHGFKLASTAQALNRFQEAQTAYEELLNLPLEQTDRADVLGNLGLIYRETNQPQLAEEAGSESLAIAHTIALTNPDKFAPAAVALNNLAILYYTTGRASKAEKAWKEAVAIYRRAPEAQRQPVMPKLASTLDNLGLIYSETKRPEEAEQAFLEALDLRRRLAESDPYAYLPDVATTLTNWAILRQKTEPASVEWMLKTALAIRCRLADINSGAFLPAKAASLYNVGLLFATSDRKEIAEKYYKNALTAYRELAEDEPRIYVAEVASMLNQIGDLYASTSRSREAEKAYTEALILRRSLAEGHPELQPQVAATLGGLAQCVFAEGRLKEAKMHAVEAANILEPLWHADPDRHGDQMARVLWVHAAICESAPKSREEAISLASTARSLVADPVLKEKIENLIDRLSQQNKA